MAKKTKRTRRTFTAEQKAAIVRLHLVDKIPVSDICDQHSLQPSLFYQWQRMVFDNLESLMAPAKAKAGSTEKKRQKQVEKLEERLSKKGEVIAEVAAEMVKLKKELGEP